MEFSGRAALLSRPSSTILTLYRIRFEHPAISDLRDSLRAGAGGWR